MDDQTLMALLPAYALDALDPVEAAQVEALLPTDPTAQAVLAEYQAAAAALLLTGPVYTPPPDLQAKLMARAQSSHRGSTARVVRIRGWWLGAAAAVAAVVLLVIWVAVKPLPDDPTPAPPPDRAAIYAQFMTHPQSTVLPVVPDVAPEAEGELVYRADSAALMLRLSHLPPLEADQAYQLWAIDEAGGFTSIGLYHWYNSGQTTYYVDIALPASLGSYQRLGMSLEPLAGSPLATEPSGPRLLNIPLRLE